MRQCIKIALALVLVVSLLIGLLYWLVISPSAQEKNALVITYLGCTNLPEPYFQQYAWLEMSNQARVSIQLDMDHVEVDGVKMMLPRHPALLGYSPYAPFGLQMDPGQAFTLPLRPPSETSGGARWRFTINWHLNNTWRIKFDRWTGKHPWVMSFTGFIYEHFAFTRPDFRRLALGPWITPENPPPRPPTQSFSSPNPTPSSLEPFPEIIPPPPPLVPGFLVPPNHALMH